MRRPAVVLSISLLLISCAKTETAQTDSVATATAAATDADFAGTWKGTVTPEGSDAVVIHFTQVCAAGNCTGTSEENKDTVSATYTIAADSAIGVSAVFTDTTIAPVPVVDRWVARVNNGQVTGHGMMVLADNRDSVVFRYRFTGSRVQQ